MSRGDFCAYVSRKLDRPEGAYLMSCRFLSLAWKGTRQRQAPEQNGVTHELQPSPVFFVFFFSNTWPLEDLNSTGGWNPLLLSPGLVSAGALMRVIVFMLSVSRFGGG